MTLYFIASVSGGITSIEHTFSGTSGVPRIFEGDGGIYIYGLGRSLLATQDNFVTVRDIIGTDQTMITAITQVAGTSQSEFLPHTVVFYRTTGLLAKCEFQRVPESVGGWNLGGSLPSSNFVPIDAICDTLGLENVLVGNSSNDSTVKIERTPGQLSFSPFAESDSGLPQSGTASRITDLENLNW